MIRFGDTHVLCAASVEDRVPPFLRNTGRGWVTAEYGMLPRSTNTRTDREAARGKQSGRTLEIQRLIGRSLRAVTKLDGFGERQVRVDCDVIQADAVHLAFDYLVGHKLIDANPLTDQVAAISAGLYRGVPVVDLDYAEDSNADADANFVLTAGGGIVEVQATAETDPFRQEQLDALLALSRDATARLFDLQRKALEDAARA